MGTSVLHIKSEVECRVYLFDEEVGIARPGKYFNLEVRKGEQDLLFVSTKDEAFRYHLIYTVEENDCDYRLTVEDYNFSDELDTPLELRKITSSTIPSKEELDRGVIDDYGIIYNANRTELLLAHNVTAKTYKIKEDCKVIRSGAFKDCKSINEIIMPNCLTHIGDNAFCECINLSIIRLPNNLTYIGDFAFCRCKSLKNIVLPTKLTYIGEYAFVGCDNLSNITLPDTLTHIDDYAFCGCSNLFTITLPKNITHIGLTPFCETNINDIICNTPYFDYKNNCLISTVDNKIIEFFSNDENVVIPSGITKIGEYAFNNCKNLRKIIIPEGLTHIEDYAFHNCENLSIIKFPSSIKHIGNYVMWNEDYFDYGALKSIIVPKGMKTHFLKLLPGEFPDIIIEQ